MWKEAIEWKENAQLPCSKKQKCVPQASKYKVIWSMATLYTCPEQILWSPERVWPAHELNMLCTPGGKRTCQRFSFWWSWWTVNAVASCDIRAGQSKGMRPGWQMNLLTGKINFNKPDSHSKMTWCFLAASFNHYWPGCYLHAQQSKNFKLPYTAARII